MTDLEVTQADRYIAIELCSEDWDAHAVIDADTEEGICCIECGPIAGAFARIRQDEQAKTDEAVAAVVEQIRQVLTERGYEEDSHYIYTLFDELPDHEQILAERDKRRDAERYKTEPVWLDCKCGNKYPDYKMAPFGWCRDCQIKSAVGNAEARLRDQIQDYLTDPNYDNRYIQGQDEAMAKMREPSPCGVKGHVMANWNPISAWEVGTTSKIPAGCDICAQQRELREDKDAEIRLLQKQLQDLSLRLNKRCEICGQTWPVGRMHNCYFCKSWVCEGCAKEHFRLHESEKSRRRALGEKEVTSEPGG